MGYGKRRYWKRDGNRRGGARPKLALAGAIVLAVGILLIFYVADVKSFDNATLAGGIAIMAGTLILLLSLSKRNQNRFVRGIDATKKIFEEPCQCCKCQNCGKNHNHWTHD